MTKIFPKKQKSHQDKHGGLVGNTLFYLGSHYWRHLEPHLTWGHAVNLILEKSCFTHPLFNVHSECYCTMHAARRDSEDRKKQKTNLYKPQFYHFQQMLKDVNESCSRTQYTEIRHGNWPDTWNGNPDNDTWNGYPRIPIKYPVPVFGETHCSSIWPINSSAGLFSSNPNIIIIHWGRAWCCTRAHLVLYEIDSPMKRNYTFHFHISRVSFLTQF